VGHVVSRDLLSQCLYDWVDEVDSNALEVHFSIDLIQLQNFFRFYFTLVVFSMSKNLFGFLGSLAIRKLYF
jgi:hypothetical protein